MHITLAQVTDVLSFALTAVSFLSLIMAQLNAKNKYLSAVTTAVAAAEKAVDKVAYGDSNTLDKAREDFAILVLSKLIPNFNDAAARKDIETILALIHLHAQALEEAAAAPSVAVVPSGNIAPQPAAVAVLKQPQVPVAPKVD